MLEALLWGGIAAGSLLVGALLAGARPWSDRTVGVVLAFGAGLEAVVGFAVAAGLSLLGET